MEWNFQSRFGQALGRGTLSPGVLYTDTTSSIHASVFNWRNYTIPI
jgi:hypothetical protein